MKRSLSLTLPLLLLSATAEAQTATSPTGYLSRAGAGFSFGFDFAEARIQFVDGEPLASPRPLKEIAFRTQEGFQVAAGRTWNRVTLEMAGADITKLSTDYNSNARTAPTRVFDGAFTLPTLQGPSQDPTPWSIRFPFTTAWAPPPGLDFLADFEFTGGVLSNNQRSWSSRNAYHLDAVDGRSFAILSGAGLGNGSAGCRDSRGNPLLVPATSFSVLASGSWSSPLYGTVSIFSTGAGFGPNLPVVLVTSLGSLPQPAKFLNVQCNGLWTDLRAPFAVTTTQTTSSGMLVSRFPAGSTAPLTLDPAWVGVELCNQGVWCDSVTNEVLLSNARQVRIPAIPVVPRHATVQPSGGANQLLTSEPNWNPIRRYTH